MEGVIFNEPGLEHLDIRRGGEQLPCCAAQVGIILTNNGVKEDPTKGD